MTFKNVLLVDVTVPNYEVFINSLNSDTCAVLYSVSTTQNELMEQIHSKTTSAERMGIVCMGGIRFFVESKIFFRSEDFIVSMIQNLGLKNVDFLACNTLKEELWKEFYGRLTERTGVVVGASNDRTGNLKNGGDWVMETTGQNIELIYFTNSIEYYKYVLDMGAFSLFAKSDGLYGMGANDYNQLGITGSNPVSTPTKINNFTNIKKIVCGQNYSMVLLTNGDLYGAGDNYSGQLGLGTAQSSTSFTLVTTGVSDVACGMTHTMIIKGTTLYGTGSNVYGNLGLSSSTYPQVNTFTEVPSGAGATALACGSYITMILKNTTLYGAGFNGDGRIGVSETAPTNLSFVEVPSGAGATQISCGDAHTLIIKGNTLYGVGDNGAGNAFGVLGLSVDTYPYLTVFTEIPSGAGATQVICGMFHSFILKGTTLYGSGSNSYGQLGVDKNTYSNLQEFTATPFGTDVKQVYSGFSHTLVLKDTSVYGIGDNYFGQIGFNRNTTSSNDSLNYTSTINNVLFLTNILESSPPPIQGTVCFPAGTLVKCDQGIIEIQKLKPRVNTLHGLPIVAITDTYSMDKEMVCIEKDALRKNYPNQTTLISPRHKVYYKGKMKAAFRLVESHKGVSFVKYDGEKLYNVLLDVYGTMSVNGLVCETLHPANPIAKIYRASMALQ